MKQKRTISVFLVVIISILVYGYVGEIERRDKVRDLTDGIDRAEVMAWLDEEKKFETN
jgi:hypothetical protein